MRTSPAVAAVLLAWQQYGVAAQTWPASTDDLEDIMFLNTGYRSRGLGTKVTPCSTGLGPGRNTAAEWLRTAFHDMATGNVFSGVGGLDGSIAFELNGGENIGDAFKSSMETYAPFVSSQTSLADVISAGVYSATRACGGPAVPIRGGRVDATASGPIGVPQPQNAIGIFRNQFARFGMDPTEMIQFTACGHTLGGVHAANFPLILDAGTVQDDFAHLDSTVASFDNKVATEYVDGTTKNPLVVGKSQEWSRNSDHVVYRSDGNVTINSLTNAETFKEVCKNMFQRMVEVVPNGVTLTDPVKPYEVKPYDLQLTLLEGGSKLRFTGDIRVRTNDRSIGKVQIAFNDRTGAAGSSSIETTAAGEASGYDDNFSFFTFDTEISAEKSVSSFSVVVTTPGGSSETFNNNGNGFKVDDTIIYQAPQSCMSGDKLTVVAAVRDGTSSPSLQVITRNSRAAPNPVPSLATATAAMATQSAVGSYQLYSADYTFSGSQAGSAVFGIVSGNAGDKNKKIDDLPSSCKPLGSSPSDGSSSSSLASTEAPSSTSKMVSSTFSSVIISSSTSASKSEATSSSSSSSSTETLSSTKIPESTIIITVTPTSPSSTPTSTPTPGSPSYEGYTYEGCMTDDPSRRTLTGKVQTTDSNSYASCASFCDGYQYFGLEFGTECYCGDIYNASSTVTQEPDSDCSMSCSGNSSQKCGAGSRLTLFKSLTEYSPPSNPIVMGYNYTGCFTDSVSARVLSDSFFYDDAMTIAKCANYCGGLKYFGTQYGAECYCGKEMGAESEQVAESDCSFVCPGNKEEFCGAGNRLSVWTRVEE